MTHVRGILGSIYLLHFDRPLAHARHYMGWTGAGLRARLVRHRTGRGSKLMAAAIAAGVGFTVARVWAGDRHEERRLKSGGHKRRCPLCKEEK